MTARELSDAYGIPSERRREHCSLYWANVNWTGGVVIYVLSALHEKQPNGYTFSRKPREHNVASSNVPDARFVGCNVVLGIAFYARADAEPLHKP